MVTLSEFHCRQCRGTGEVCITRLPITRVYDFGSDLDPSKPIQTITRVEPCPECSGTGLDLPCFHGRDAPWKPICGLRFLGKQVFYDSCDNVQEPSKDKDREDWLAGRYVVYQGVRVYEAVRNSPIGRDAVDRLVGACNSRAGRPEPGP